MKDLSLHSQFVTVLSWLTYPVVYVFPMLGFSGANPMVAIQLGYGISEEQAAVEAPAAEAGEAAA